VQRRHRLRKNNEHLTLIVTAMLQSDVEKVSETVTGNLPHAPQVSEPAPMSREVP
jgi:hypothetical protein